MADRSQRLRELSNAKTHMFQEHHLGKPVEVLLEMQEPNGQWSGYTPSYLRIRTHREGNWRNRMAILTPTNIEGDFLIS
jgi:tRNA A37 methylthiotransferase MiaB